jgi:hypothetical protein
MVTMLNLHTTALNSLSGVLLVGSYRKFPAPKIAYPVVAGNSPSYSHNRLTGITMKDIVKT